MEQIILQNERLRFRIGKEKGALIPMAMAKEVFGKLLTSLKARSYANIVRIVTLARLAPNTATAAAEVKVEVDAMWKNAAFGKWINEVPAATEATPANPHPQGAQPVVEAAR